jgi:hypothetical protein
MIMEDRNRDAARTPREGFEHMRKLDPRTSGESAAEIIRRIREGGELRAPTGTLNVRQIMERIERLGLTERDEAVGMIREDRDR